MQLSLDPASKLPIYEQIVRSMKTMVMTGKLHAHEPVPSVRKTAAALGINPNTVQKAFALLRQEGILYSVAGKGDFVADNGGRIKEMKRQEIRDMFVRATQEARDSGMWIDEIFTIVDEAYSGG